MLTGGQLATAITAVLVAAVAVGWVLHWAWIRLSNAAVSDAARVADLSERLHEVDRSRQAAEEGRVLAEQQLASREAEMEERLAAMEARLHRELEAREVELASSLHEAWTVAEAAISDLQSAHRRITELEAELDRLVRARQ